MAEVTTLAPQEGPQTRFLATQADIAIYGGAAGGGKTWALLFESLRHIDNPGFRATTFRNSYKQIALEGGLWDESEQLYPLCGAEPRITRLAWRFPSGARVAFSYMEAERDKYVYQGAQIPLICFDQLEQFSGSQFWYMLSRNRSTCGVRPYVRATCNPLPGIWLTELLSWWINQETGYAIPEHSGTIRWFARVNEQIVWADTEEELRTEYPKSLPKSLTFIPASIYDNKILLEQDPGYLANLMALPLVERERLAHGNWKIRAQAGNVLRREWFEIVAAAPAQAKRVRFWDLAATEKKTKGDDPDWTAGARVSYHDGIYYIEHIVRTRSRWHGVKELIAQTATIDGRGVRIGVEREPGASGKALIAELVRFEKLAGRYAPRGFRSAKDKLTRANPWAAQAEAGNVKIVKGNWDIEAFLNECVAFPEGAHDDQVDAVSGAVALLARSGPVIAFV